MKRIKYLLRQIFTAIVITLLIGIAPAPVFAEDAGTDGTSPAPTSDQQSAVEKPSNGTNGPTGSASFTYTYNDGTGLWENDYYTYNPVTKDTVPKVPLEYTYNPLTGMWDTNVWQFSASKGSYSQTLVSVTAPPFGAITHGGPEPVSNQPATNNSNSSNGSSEASTGGSPSSDGSNGGNQVAANSQAPTGGNNIDKLQNIGVALTFNNAGTITNFIDSTARSGNSLVISNTTAGNVGTGNASAMTNIINLLQSQSSFGGNGFATFTKDIQGDVNGDLVIDPSAFAQPANINSQNLANYKLNEKTEGSIVNNIDLNANSGNATATKNTAVGDLSTGSADAIANVVNMINSVVAANQSFMGVVNIYGNYTGNILVPTDSLNVLLGSTGPGASTTIAQSANVSNTVDANSEQNINNNVNLAAVSGTASASENTRAGSVASGDALTNLTILNLTGRQVVAANSLLVFVNVLGSWVGLIMDAPAGSTAAAYGGDVTVNNALEANSTVNSSEKFGITNNINANAASGNADATKNTTVGNVRTGDATATANVANLIGSNLSLSNWFGVLFINVFGTWRGNFGAVKPPVAAPVTNSAAGGGMGAGDIATALEKAKVFAFTPTNTSGGAKLGLSPLSEANQNSGVTSAEMVQKVSKVLAASTGKGIANPSAPQSVIDNNFAWSAVMVAIGLAGLGFVGVDRVRTNLRERHSRR